MADLLNKIQNPQEEPKPTLGDEVRAQIAESQPNPLLKFIVNLGRGLGGEGAEVQKEERLRKKQEQEQIAIADRASLLSEDAQNKVRGLFQADDLKKAGSFVEKEERDAPIRDKVSSLLPQISNVKTRAVIGELLKSNPGSAFVKAQTELNRQAGKLRRDIKGLRSGKDVEALQKAAEVLKSKGISLKKEPTGFFSFLKGSEIVSQSELEKAGIPKLMAKRIRALARDSKQENLGPEDLLELAVGTPIAEEAQSKKEQIQALEQQLEELRTGRKATSKPKKTKQVPQKSAKVTQMEQKLGRALIPIEIDILEKQGN